MFFTCTLYHSILLCFTEFWNQRIYSSQAYKFIFHVITFTLVINNNLLSHTCPTRCVCSILQPSIGFQIIVYIVWAPVAITMPPDFEYLPQNCHQKEEECLPTCILPPCHSHNYITLHVDNNNIIVLFCNPRPLLVFK
jgi:hypothetical protein